MSNETVKKGNETVNTIDEVYKIFENDWNKQVILYGPPGTSKTYSSTIIAAKMLGCDSTDYNECEKHLKKDEVSKRFKLVQFHPSYCYEDFVRGIKAQPDPKKNQLNYKVVSQTFEKFCIDAGKAIDNPAKYKYDKNTAFVFVIDEINRAPLASVLGELIYALEYRGQPVASSYTLEEDESGKKIEDKSGKKIEDKSGKKIEDKSGKKIEDKGLIVPPNVYIIGTMNTADRSIGSIDYAVRRRFAFVHVGSESTAIKDSWKDDPAVGEKAEKIYDELMGKNGIFKEDLLVDHDMDVEDIKIGHTYFLGKDKADEKYLEYRLQYQVIPIYLEYIKDGIIKKEGKEVLNDILENYNMSIKI